jgi:hypothetical protein
MARDGYKIFDSDTHVGPDARILARYLSATEKYRLRDWEEYKSRDRTPEGSAIIAGASAWPNPTTHRPAIWLDLQA